MSELEAMVFFVDGDISVRWAAEGRRNPAAAKTQQQLPGARRPHCAIRRCQRLVEGKSRSRVSAAPSLRASRIGSYPEDEH